MVKVALMGTCENSTWRERLIKLLTCEYFNPVVEEWTEAAKQEEKEEREKCDIVLYVLTPAMTGVYSIAEVTEDAIKVPTKTILCILENDIFFDKETNEEVKVKFIPSALGSMKAISELIQRNGAKTFWSLEDIALYLNNL